MYNGYNFKRVLQQTAHSHNQKYQDKWRRVCIYSEKKSSKKLNKKKKGLITTHIKWKMSFFL